MRNKDVLNNPLSVSMRDLSLEQMTLWHQIMDNDSDTPKKKNESKPRELTPEEIQRKKENDAYWDKKLSAFTGKRILFVLVVTVVLWNLMIISSKFENLQFFYVLAYAFQIWIRLCYVVAIGAFVFTKGK